MIYSLFLLFPILLILRYPVLTETGIRRTFAGISYRFVPWPEVRDVMRVYNQAYTHGMMTLMVTTTQAMYTARDEKGYIPPAQRRVLPGMIAGKTL